MKRTPIRRLSLLLLTAALAGCGQDAGPVATEALAPSGVTARMLAPGEGLRILEQYIDAAGNSVLIAEYGAGGYAADDPRIGPVATITIRTVAPPAVAGSSSDPCITSSIVKIEKLAGWTTSVKKPGGCDKEIVVDLENSATRESAQFRFLYIFGKTKIDSGLIR
jgi:hypothetical protein